MFRTAPKCTIVAIGTAFALCATAAFAAAPSHEEEQPIVLAQAGSSRTAIATSNDAGAGYPSHQAGVRRAAAEGPDALRRYIDRTRMIYGFYYWDFATRE